MATETLRINITADNKAAITAVKQVKEENEKFKLSLADLNAILLTLKQELKETYDPKRVTKLGTEIVSVTKKIFDQEVAYRKLGATIESANPNTEFIRTSGILEQLTNRLTLLKNGLKSATDVKDIKVINELIGKTQSEFNKLSSIGVSAGKSIGNEFIKTPGIIEAATNRLVLLKNGLKSATDPKDITVINKLIGEQERHLLSLNPAAEKSGNALSKAFSGLRSIAYILPGIGIAGIFNLAFEAIGKAADELGIFAKKEDAAATAAAEFNKELSKQREGATTEISQLTALADAANNNSLSNKQRLQAVKQLRAEYPAYFKDLTDEQILTGNITKATGLLTDAIYKRAEARAREADIAKKATTVFENQNRLAEIENKLIDVRKSKAKGAVVVGGGSLGAGSGTTDAGFNRTLSDETKLLKEKEQLLTQTSALTINIAGQQLKVNAISAETIKLGYKEVKGTKEKVSVFEQMLDKLAHIQDEYSRRIIDNTEYNKKSISVIDEESKHLKLNSDEYKKAILLRDQFYQQNKDKSNPLTRFAIATGREFSGEQITTPKHLSATDNVAVNAASETSLTKKKADLEEFNKTMAQSATLASIGAAAFSTMFDAMAKGESIGEAIANVFKDLVKQLAISVAKAITFAVILNVISGGAYSIGKIFVGALGGNMTGKGYANGGVSTGSKSGHMELLHGTEAILTPSQFSGLFNAGVQTGQMSGSNSGSQHIEISGRISGQDIWLSKQRTDFQRSLTT